MTLEPRHPEDETADSGVDAGCPSDADSDFPDYRLNPRTRFHGDGGWEKPSSSQLVIVDRAPAADALLAWTKANGFGLTPVHVEGDVSIRLHQVPASLVVAQFNELLGTDLSIGRPRGELPELVSDQWLAGFIDYEEPKLRIVQVNERPAEELVTLIQPLAGKFGDVHIDRATNRLLLHDSYRNLELEERLIRALDHNGPVVCACLQP
jgi:hypothetical protein